jgi:hypothetical protein
VLATTAELTLAVVDPGERSMDPDLYQLAVVSLDGWELHRAVAMQDGLTGLPPFPVTVFLEQGCSCTLLDE